MVFSIESKYYTSITSLSRGPFFCGEIDQYAARYGAFADKVWKEEYLKQSSVTISCASSSIGVSMAMKPSS
jgi:hypothetical protein